MIGHTHPLSFQATSDRKEKRIKVDTDTFCCTNPFLGECLSLDETKAKHPSVAANPSKCFATKGLCETKCRLPSELTGRIMTFAGPQDWKKVMKSEQQSRSSFNLAEKPLVVGQIQRKVIQQSQAENPNFALSTELNYRRMQQLEQRQNDMDRELQAKIRQRRLTRNQAEKEGRPLTPQEKEQAEETERRWKLFSVEAKELEALQNPRYWDQRSTATRDAIYILDALNYLNEQVRWDDERLIVQQVMSLFQQKRGTQMSVFVMTRFMTRFMHQIMYASTYAHSLLYQGAIRNMIRLFPDLWKNARVQEQFIDVLQFTPEWSVTMQNAANFLGVILFPALGNRGTDWSDTEFSADQYDFAKHLQASYLQQYNAECDTEIVSHDSADKSAVNVATIVLFRRYTTERYVDEIDEIRLWGETLAASLPTNNVIIILKQLCVRHEPPFLVPLLPLVTALIAVVLPTNPNNQDTNNLKLLISDLEGFSKRIFETYNLTGKNDWKGLSETTITKTKECFKHEDDIPLCEEWKASLAVDISRHNFIVLHEFIVKRLVTLREQLKGRQATEAEQSADTAPAPASASASSSNQRQQISAAALARVRDREQKQRALLEMNPLGRPAAAAAAAVAATVEGLVLRPAAAAAASLDTDSDKEAGAASNVEDWLRSGGIHLTTRSF
jgi:hypothetical protein